MGEKMSIQIASNVAGNGRSIQEEAVGSGGRAMGAVADEAAAATLHRTFSRNRTDRSPRSGRNHLSFRRLRSILPRLSARRYLLGDESYHSTRLLVQIEKMGYSSRVLPSGGSVSVSVPNGAEIRPHGKLCGEVHSLICYR